MARKKNVTFMRFQSIEQRDKQLRAFKPGTYSIDKKDPLVVYIYFI